MAEFLNFLMDPNERKKILAALLDSANRGMVAGTLGAPVDVATQAANLGIAGAGYAGHKLGLLNEPPELIDPSRAIGSSEWIGRKMQERGIVSPNRNEIAEMGMAMLSPVAARGAGAVGRVVARADLAAAENAAKAGRVGPISGQRGVFRFPESMTRPEKSQAVKGMADSAAERLRSLGFDVEVQHSGSAMGPSSYVRVYDPQTGRFIKDPLRISDHSKGPFNSQFVHDAAGPEDIDSFIESAQSMRAMGPTDLHLQQMNSVADASKKMAEKLAPVRDRAMQKQQNGEPLSNSEKKAIAWFEKNQ